MTLAFAPAGPACAALDLLKIELAADIAHVQLNRPAKRNAINDELVSQLQAFFSGPPESVRAVVLSGAGDHFCAGLDLSELSERNVAEGVLHSRAWHVAMDAIQFVIALSLQKIPLSGAWRQAAAPLAAQILPSLVAGGLVSFLYVLARPRLGPGPRTALWMGTLAWGLVVQPFFNPMTWLNAPLLTFGFLALAWLKYIAATYIAGWQYMEKAPQ